MDARLAALARLRDVKMKAAHRDYIEALREYQAAVKLSEALELQRKIFAQQSSEASRTEMEQVMTGVSTGAEIQAVHLATERRNGAILEFDRKIAEARQRQSELQIISTTRQKEYAIATRAVEKLRILGEKLRLEEISLQDRLSESFADSASWDAVTGQWKLR